jgi:hypothetical protein
MNQFLGALVAASIAGVLFGVIWVQRQNITALVLQIRKLGKDLGGKEQAERQLAMMVTISQSRIAREQAFALLLSQPKVKEAVADYIRNEREMVEFLLEMGKLEKAAALEAKLESLLTALEHVGITPESLSASDGAS